VKPGRRVGKAMPTPTPTPTPAPVATPPAEVEEWKPTTELMVEYSGGIRFNVAWPRALRAFAKNPLLGTGYSSVTLAVDNDYLRTLAETGILGLLAFGLIFLEITRRVIVYLKQAKPSFERSVVIGISGAAVGFFANAVFIDVFAASKVAFIFWLLVGILIGIIKITEKSRQYAKTE
jgi:O-antigen ligase